MYYILLHNTILLCTAHYYHSKNSTDLSLTALYSSILHCSSNYSHPLQCMHILYIAVHGIELNNKAKYYLPLHCTALDYPSYTTWHYPPMHCAVFSFTVNNQSLQQVSAIPHASKLEVILIEQAAWRLSNSKVTRKPPLLDKLTIFGQSESAPAILGLC